MPAAESRQPPGRGGVAAGEQQGGSRGNTRGYPGQRNLDEWGQVQGAKSGEQVVQMPKLEALIRRLFQLGLDGDLAALRLILSMVAHKEAENKAVEEAKDGAASLIPDDDTLRRMLARFDYLYSPKKESNDD